MNYALAAVVTRLPAAGRGRRRGLHHHALFHDAFTSHPWLAWTAVGLLLAVAVLGSVGKVITTVFRGTPWWARLGLVGALVYAWHRRRTGPSERRDGSPFR